MGWQEELNWAIGHVRGKNPTAEVFRMTLAGAQNFIWKERN